MTARQLWEATLIELNKVQAPSLLLEDYNYFINKAVYQYVNKKYNIYDVNQQTTDDIRVLKATTKILVDSENKNKNPDSLYGSAYEFDLPKDYLHILNCICEYKVNKPFKCYDSGTIVHFKANRLTADLYGEILNNYYMRPSYKRPYYYINNINTNKSEIPNTNVGELTDQFPTNPVTNGRGTDISGISIVEDKQDSFKNSYAKDPIDSGLNRTISVNGTVVNAVEKVSQVRYGNPSNIRMEIRYGKDTSLFQLNSIYIDYIKTPQNIRLAQEQIDFIEDKSQILEFPDYVCQEIINELVHIVMENASDPRLQTHIPVSQSIANPAQQQTQQK